MPTKTTFRPGDVVSYTPADRWAREGTAVARQINGKIVLVDTFWGSSLNGNTQDCHTVTEAEAATVEVLFNLTDWQAWSDRRNGKPGACWADFHPDDRQVITSQHGLERALFVRPGATPDLSTRISNARDELANREQTVRSAERARDRARDELAALLTQQAKTARNTEGDDL